MAQLIDERGLSMSSLPHRNKGEMKVSQADAVEQLSLGQIRPCADMAEFSANRRRRSRGGHS
jgi:hypothetical protein